MSLICQRCHSLKSHNKLLDFDMSRKNEFKAGVPLKLSEYVASFNRKEIIRNVFKQIYSRSIIVYVIDITNFEGS
jgi:hypothetical protein